MGRLKVERYTSLFVSFGSLSCVLSVPSFVLCYLHRFVRDWKRERGWLPSQFISSHPIRFVLYSSTRSCRFRLRFLILPAILFSFPPAYLPCSLLASRRDAFSSRLCLFCCLLETYLSHCFPSAFMDLASHYKFYIPASVSVSVSEGSLT